MKIVAIGSVALGYYMHTTPKDVDVIIHFDDLIEFQEDYQLVSLVPRTANKFHGIDGKGKHYEIELAGIIEGSSRDLLYELADTFPEQAGFRVPPLELLYEIKLTHRYIFGRSFEKTRKHILTMRPYLSGAIDPAWTPFLKMRRKEQSKPHPKLKGVDKGEFFVDRYGDVAQIDHDTIHLTQALCDKPAYLSFQVGEVECCMKTFFKVDEQIRLSAVFEESATLAVERAIWPTQFECDEFKAFQLSLQKLCCHISSGKFREYCWENYHKVLAMYRTGDIIRKFKEGLSDGTIRFQEGEEVPDNLQHEVTT